MVDDEIELHEEELLSAIDKFLTSIMHQTMIDTSRVIDFTLDLRQIVLSKKETYNAGR
jgi:hypothetical protein